MWCRGEFFPVLTGFFKPIALLTIYLCLKKSNSCTKTGANSCGVMMGYRGMGNGYVSAICDACGERSGSRERRKLEKAGWELYGDTLTGEKHAYCPECAPKFNTYQKRKGRGEVFV